MGGGRVQCVCAAGMAAVRMYNFGTLRQFCRSALTFGSARASALIFHQLLLEMLRILTLLTLATCGACGAECGEECVNDVNVASGSSAASRSQSLLQVAKTQTLGRARQWRGPHVYSIAIPSHTIPYPN